MITADDLKDEVDVTELLVTVDGELKTFLSPHKMTVEEIINQLGFINRREELLAKAKKNMEVALNDFLTRP